MNFVRGTVENGKVAACGLNADIRPIIKDAAAVEGKKVVFAFRPEAIKIAHEVDKTQKYYEITSKVELTELLGDTTNVYAVVGCGEEKVNIILKVNPHYTPAMGEEFKFYIPQSAAYLFDAETEQIIENEVVRH